MDLAILGYGPSLLFFHWCI